jgi:hypothetical protein
MLPVFTADHSSCARNRGQESHLAITNGVEGHDLYSSLEEEEAMQMS